MRQSDGSKLFAEGDPRSSSVGLINVDPEDDRQSVLAAILTQDKLGRRQTVVNLPDPNNALRHPTDFEGLRNTQRRLQTQIQIVAPKDSTIAGFARQQRFPVFLSLDNYASYAQSFLKSTAPTERVPEATEQATLPLTSASEDELQPTSDTDAPPVASAPQDEPPAAPASEGELRPTGDTDAPPPYAIEDEQTRPLPNELLSTAEPGQPVEAVPESEVTNSSPESAPERVPSETNASAESAPSDVIAQEEEAEDATPIAPLAPDAEEPSTPPERIIEAAPIAKPYPVVPPQGGGVPLDEEEAGPQPLLLQPSRPPALPALRQAPPYPPRRRRTRWPLIVAILLVLLVLLLGGLGLFNQGPLAPFFPGAASAATITITPNSKDLRHSYLISAVMQTPDPLQHQVRARSLSSLTPSQSQTVKVSGLGTIPAVQAQGSLTFYNALPYQQTVPVGTVFTDPNGIQVINDKAAIIPGAQPPTEGSITVQTHAAAPGAKGNIAAGDFRAVSCCQPGITISNLDVFAGGEDQQTYSYVQQSDIDSAANAMKATLLQNAQRALQVQVLAGEQFVQSMQCTPNVDSDHAAGDKTTSVTVTETVACLAEVYDQRGALLLAENLLRADASNNPGAAYGLVGHIITTPQAPTISDNKGTVAVRVNTEGVWVYQFDTARKAALARLVVNKNESDALKLLARQSGVSKTTITLTGGNGEQLPTDARQITVVVAGPSGVPVTPIPAATLTPSASTSTPTISPATPASSPGSPASSQTPTVTNPEATATPPGNSQAKTP